MRFACFALAFGSLVFTVAAAPPPFQASFDSSAKWEAVRGVATPDSATPHDKHSSLRVEAAGESGAFVRSTPVNLTVGKRYELSGWVRTESLKVHDVDRSPIATGASIGMASMPFDVHSESLGGTRSWTKLNLKFTATRSQDQIVLAVADGGAFSGKAWFEGVSLEEIGQPGGLPQKAALRTYGAGYRYPSAGWIYLHIEGEPYERGYQHGYLMAREIEQYIDRCAAQLDPKSRSTAWNNGRTSANALFLRGFDKEILQEMKGIADGAAAAGARYQNRPVDLIDVVTLNTITELGELNSAMPVTPTGLEGIGFKAPHIAPEPTGGNDHCSAFAACGKATKDGKMVIGHVTWWPLTLAEQTNLMLDVVPTTGHRVLMQSYPGGIQSGTDWYQNDLGVVLTETTIEQSPFNVKGTPVAYRARKAIQYGDSIDKVVEHLKTDNNGLYTNEWIIGDARTNEIAMIELGTYRTRLYRSSKNDWFAGTEGFYWGCNNAKDLNVRLEYAPDPKWQPQDLPFVPAIRDIKWQQMYQQYKGKIDEGFGFTAFRTAPLVAGSTMDSKVTTSEMASKMMTWALFGKPNQREWVPTPQQKESFAGNDGLYSSGYKLFQAHEGSQIKALTADAPKATVLTSDDGNRNRGDGGGRRGRRGGAASANADRLWRGWILPASDADVWFTAGSATYYEVLSGDEPDKKLDFYRAMYRAAALEGEQPLSKIAMSTTSQAPHTIAETKGMLALDALRREMGDDAFYALMKDFFERNTTKTIRAADFMLAAGSTHQALFTKWLDSTGLPEKSEGAIYAASAFRSRLSTAMIVYGTVAEAGANRYAAEQWQQQFIGMYESQVPIRKDFEVTDAELAQHDVLFVGRPETNSALTAWTKQVGIDYDGGVFKLAGKDHGSETDAVIWTATNPQDRKHMVIVAAGNSPLSTVTMTRAGFGQSQYQLVSDGKTVESGFAEKQ
jgi:hypothetical protein